MMIRKYEYICTILVIALLNLGTATAQEVENSAASSSPSEQAVNSPVSIEQVDLSNIDHNDAVKKIGLDYLFKQSFGTSDIFSSMSNFDGNRAGVAQYGNSNNALIEQDGTGNVGLIQIGSPSNRVQNNVAEVYQTGNQLLSLINMQGNNNYLLFNQSGNSRGALFNFEGNNLQYTAEQSNAGFNLRPKGGSSPALKIESTRRIVPVIISN